MLQVSFREAVEPDWSGIWRVFAEVVRGDDAYMYPPTLTEAEARQVWWQVADRARNFVALRGDEVVGTAILRPNHPGRGAHVANAAWMVSASVRGQGVGRAFAEYVIDAARAQRFDAMVFNAVVSTNAPALRLWRSLGFAVVGTVPDGYAHSEQGRVDVYIMHRSL